MTGFFLGLPALQRGKQTHARNGALAFASAECVKVFVQSIHEFFLKAYASFPRLVAPVIPAQAGIQKRKFVLLDSRLRGNDDMQPQNKKSPLRRPEGAFCSGISPLKL